MVDKQELNDTAKAMAQFANDERMHCHRGILPLDKQLHVLFGNDCYATDERSQAEANAVQEAALQAGCPASDIQTDDSSLTWAIAFEGDKKLADVFFKIAAKTWFDESMKRAASSGSRQEA